MPSGYPDEPKTIGEHLRKRRLDLQLLQGEVAVIIGVDKATIENWEYGRTSPNLRTCPAVLEFLGYDPRLSGRTVGEKLRRHREGLGLSLDEAAAEIAVDSSTLWKWETGKREPQGRYLELLRGFLDTRRVPFE